MLRRHAIASLLRRRSLERKIAGLKSRRFFDGAHGGAVLVDRKTRRVIAAQRRTGWRCRQPPGSTLKPLVLQRPARTRTPARRRDISLLRRSAPRGPLLRLLASAGLDRPMTVRTAIAYSCNCFVAHYASRFHAGELTPRAGCLGLFGTLAIAVRRSELQALGEDGVLVTPASLAMAYRRLAVARRARGAGRDGGRGAVRHRTARTSDRACGRGQDRQRAQRRGCVCAWFAGFTDRRGTVMVQATLGRSGRGARWPREFWKPTREVGCEDAGRLPALRAPYAAAPVTLKVRLKLGRTPRSKCRWTNMSRPFWPAKAAPSAATKPSRRWRWPRAPSPSTCADGTPRKATISAALRIASGWSRTWSRRASQSLADADRRRTAVVRRQAGLRVLLAQLRRHDGGRRAVWGGLHVALPAQPRRPVLPAAGRGAVALERRMPQRIAAALKRRKLQRAGGDDGIADRAAHRLGTRARAGCSSARANRSGSRRVRSASRSAVRWAAIRCAAIAGKSVVSRRTADVRGRGRRPRRRNVPARRRPDGRRRSRLSRDSGVLLPGHRDSGVTAQADSNWRRMGGETRRADDDAARSRRPGAGQRGAAGERDRARSMAGAAPAKIEIRVYPDVETFRNATGEPGWVAARTTGSRIDLQPAAPRESTIRHELLHVFVESQASSDLARMVPRRPGGLPRASRWRPPPRRSPRPTYGRPRTPPAPAAPMPPPRNRSRPWCSATARRSIGMAQDRPSERHRTLTSRDRRERDEPPPLPPRPRSEPRPSGSDLSVCASVAADDGDP